MNRKEYQKESLLSTELSGRKLLNDEDYRHFHHVALEIISVAVENKRLFFPAETYCRYKGYVKLMDIICNKIRQGQEVISSSTLEDIYQHYQAAAEDEYYVLYQLIVSAYRRTTDPEERNYLYNLIQTISQIGKEEHIK